MLQLTNKQWTFVRAARVAHLATANAAGQPLVVPICFVSDGKEFFSPIDEKPKQISPARLRRLRNLAENPKVSLIIDRYDEDWRRLTYVLITGKGKVMFRGERHKKAVKLLRRKYAQYRRMAIDHRPIISIRAIQAKVWGDPR
jgi:PPOX class probable F420-dependent enzyme